MIPSRFTQSDVGEMFIVRNAGVLIPHFKYYGKEATISKFCSNVCPSRRNNFSLQISAVIVNLRHVLHILQAYLVHVLNTRNSYLLGVNSHCDEFRAVETSRIVINRVTDDVSAALLFPAVNC